MKKKIMAITISIALVAIITVGATLAYFTDTKTVANTFTVGDVHIALTETKWNSSAAHQIIPGATFEKNPVVKNTGANDAYIRVKVAFSNAAALKAIFPNFEDQLLASSALKGFDSTKWKTITGAVDKDVLTVTLVYKGTMAKDGSVTVFTDINFPTSITNQQAAALAGFSITVTADAIQSQGFNTEEEAFAAFDAK